MNFEVEVKIEDKDHIYRLELRKLLKLLEVDRTDEEILSAVREAIRRT